MPKKESLDQLITDLRRLQIAQAELAHGQDPSSPSGRTGTSHRHSPEHRRPGTYQIDRQIQIHDRHNSQIHQEESDYKIAVWTDHK